VEAGSHPHPHLARLVPRQPRVHLTMHTEGHQLPRSITSRTLRCVKLSVVPA
jgi:hypothetical protein